MAASRKSAHQRKLSRERVQAHRARLRAEGLRPVQIWLPDTRSAAYVAEVRRQALSIANSPHAADDQAFIDSVSVIWDLDDEAW